MTKVVLQSQHVEKTGFVAFPDRNPHIVDDNPVALYRPDAANIDNKRFMHPQKLMVGELVQNFLRLFAMKIAKRTYITMRVPPLLSLLSLWNPSQNSICKSSGRILVMPLSGAAP